MAAGKESEMSGRIHLLWAALFTAMAAAAATATPAVLAGLTVLPVD
jgi:hypothetical protein